MKLQKLLSIFLTGLICFTSIPIATITAEESELETIDIWDGSTDTSWYDSEETELYISTPEELAGLAELVNSGKTMEGKIFYLENDIYLNDVSNFENWLSGTKPENTWIPIGKDEKNCFSGTFDGNGYKIKGIYICNFYYFYDDSECTSLENSYHYIQTTGNTASSFIGYLVSGEIRNVIFENEYISSGSKVFGGEFCSGGVCAYSKSSKISNIATFNGFVRAIYDYDYMFCYAGGICGYGEDTIIRECKNAFNVRGVSHYESGKVAGGIVGVLDGSSSVYNCENTGNINSYSFTNYQYSGSSGGICGYASCFETVENVYNVGNVKSVNYAGSILGNLGYQADISNLKNAYYLSGTAIYGVGYGLGYGEDDVTIAKTEENMKTEGFAKALGKAFVYVEGEYPKLLWEIDYIVANFIEEDISLTEYGQQKSPELVTNYTESPTWVSSDTSVATVENGVVTAKNNGECVIYAVCGDVRAECNVTVDYGYTLSTTNIEINEDETAQLSVISDNTGLAAEGFEIEWTSSDESVVTVENGTVTPVDDGTATITASFGDTSLECEVVVNALIPDPELNITSLELYEGETEELTVNNYTGNITWISDNTEVAKVENGIVKAIAPGNANIYAMLSNGTNLICAVTINEAEVTSVTTTNVTTTETATVTTIVTTVTEDTVNTDLNGDGKTNVADVLILQKFLVNIPSDINVEIIDINNDKKINVFDLIILKRIVLYS